MVERSTRSIAKRPESRSRLLLENTAGQGTCLGWRFEHLADHPAASRARAAGRLHRHLPRVRRRLSAGHPRPSTRPRWPSSTTRRSGAVKAIHLNDSKQPLGLRVDRHEHIGRGNWASNPFACCSTTALPRDADVPGNRQGTGNRRRDGRREPASAAALIAMMRGKRLRSPGETRLLACARISSTGMSVRWRTSEATLPRIRSPNRPMAVRRHGDQVAVLALGRWPGCGRSARRKPESCRPETLGGQFGLAARPDRPGPRASRPIRRGPSCS